MTTSESEALQAAIDAATRLKPGSWESVESLSVLALESGDPAFLDIATKAAERLTPGTWDAVRALTWLARAQRELATD